MKKLSIALLILIMAFSSVGVFAATSAEGFVYNGSKVTGYEGADAEIVVPSEIDGQTITAIGSKAFQNKLIVYAEIEEGITTIESGAFSGSDLVLCVLPSTLSSVGEDAFKNCDGLQAIVFMSSDCTLGKNSLKGTTENLNISVPCDADISTWNTRLAAAKGDSNFVLNYEHEWVDTDLKDAAGNTVSKCEHCGAYSSEPVGTIPFIDVPLKSWYYSAVATAYSYGIINGVTEIEFQPEKNMTRAEAVKIAAMVYSVQMDSTRETANALLELAKSSKVWYEPYVAYGLSEGFIPLESEFASEDFDWSKNATRAEMAFLFANADRNTTVINNVTYDMIPGVDAGTKYGPEILLLYQRGIAQGSDATHRYNPEFNVTRNEVATFITRLMVEETRITL